MSQNPNLARNPDYYCACAAEERELARSSTDANARNAHERLAEQYEQLARSGGEEVATDDPNRLVGQRR